MKIKNSFTLMALCFLLAGCGGAKEYSVKGDIEGLEGNVSLMYNKETVAVATTDNGSFSFCGDADIPGVYYLMSGSDRLALLFIENGEKIKVAGKIIPEGNEITVTGSTAHENANSFKEWETEFGKEYNTAQGDERMRLYKEKKEYTLKTISENSDNVFGIHLLNTEHYSMDPEIILEKLDEFPEKFADNHIVVKMRTTAEALARTAEGKQYVDFSLPDINGNDLSLSDVIGPGKYVYVDFWASWCGPCLAQLPDLREVYAKYHEKGLEIFGVSLDSDRGSWVKSTKDNLMDWYHVSGLQGWNCPVVKEYGVTFVPTTLLIGPDGTIIAKHMHGKMLEEKLAELIK